jgi:methionyl-tRNA formyltransferase
MRSVVFAYQEVGYVCLEALLGMGAEVCAVFTHEDDAGEEVWFRSVADLACRNNLPVFYPDRVGTPEWLARLRQWDADFLFSFYYRKILPPEVLTTARRGALNLHGSLLPRYRGRCPVNWVLIHGEQETGVTLHYMEARADRGDIVAQRRVLITENDTARTLYAKMTEAAEKLMRETYPLLCAGTAPRVPQDHAAATKFGGRRPEDGLIDWHVEAQVIHNLVRAVTHPYPGAFTRWKGRRVFVWEARVGGEHVGRELRPGTVVATDGGLVVQTGAGCLRVTRLQLDGEDEMPAAEWAQRHAVEEGVEFK